MEIKDILRKQAGFHRGFQPRTISKTSFTPDDVVPRLKRIPGKITAYFHRDKIKDVFKSNHERRAENNYYIIRAIDNTLFHIDF